MRDIDQVIVEAAPNQYELQEEEKQDIGSVAAVDILAVDMPAVDMPAADIDDIDNDDDTDDRLNLPLQIEEEEKIIEER